jgi:prepilin-type processing-associated H-X9-DG protein
MYKIRGADQKEYGPVTADVVRQWIAQGRMSAETLVQAEGSGDWQPLAGYPEFAVAPAPPLPGVAPGPSRPPGPAPTSGLAIASLVCGVLGCLGITALVGLVLGLVALVKINKSQGRLGGKGLAITGICVSGVMMFVALPVLAGLTLPALAKAKSRAQTVQCVNNLKQLCLATIMYANDNKDTLPTAAKWGDLIQTNLGSPAPFHCAGDPSGQRSSYAFNAKLGGASLDKISPQTVLFFECQGGWNVSGGASAMISHHAGTYTVGFVDGHVEQVRAAGLSQLRWEP